MQRGQYAIYRLFMLRLYATQSQSNSDTSSLSYTSLLLRDGQGVASGAATVMMHMAPVAFNQAFNDLNAIQKEANARATQPLAISPVPTRSAGVVQAPVPASQVHPVTLHSTENKEVVQPNDIPKPRITEARERSVPSGPLSRIWHFSMLAAGLAAGSAAQSVRNLVGPPEERKSVLLSDANMDRMVNTVCRMRGAVLKLGQMLSIQDENVLPPALLQAFARVRDAADIMPQHQLERQMEANFGPQWRGRFAEFDMKPVASASIGQVHPAILPDGTKVAVKVQFPGVAESIDSDVNNLTRLFTFNVLPSGLYVDKILHELRRELREECNYVLEAEKLQKYKSLLALDPLLSFFETPAIIPDLCTARILTMTYVSGTPIDRVASLRLPQAVRNNIGKNLFRLTLAELFLWRYMQTDPNYSNFLYNPDKDKVYLLDFGAAREYEPEFIKTYLRIVDAARRHDKGVVLNLSRKIGFLTGEENEAMNDAHCNSVFLLAEPFAAEEEYDFQKAQIPSRISSNVGVMLKNRLRPPPTEIYSLHRRLSGLYLGCAQIGAAFCVKPIFEEVLQQVEM